MKLLVTGGAGYIGSHTVLQLLESQHEVFVLDNLCNSSEKSLDRVRGLSERCISFIKGDIRDTELLERLFSENAFEAVIHFAGLKAVGESTEKPLEYYDNNVQGSITLFRAMKKAECFNLVFSSSATVYGDPDAVPITEVSALRATNPYGQTKLVIEGILRDLSNSDERWNVALLRYFNPVGAHFSGLIGEDPNGVPNNLMPFISQVAVGKRKQLNVFGGDYSTPDGTGVRDYIHVEDLADGHIKALSVLKTGHGCKAYNLGTGKGISVLEMIHAFAHFNEVDVPYLVVDRRPGDIAKCYADPALAESSLGWRAQKCLGEMVTSAWRWQLQNPDGYQETTLEPKAGS